MLLLLLCLIKKTQARWIKRLQLIFPIYSSHLYHITRFLTDHLKSRAPPSDFVVQKKEGLFRNNVPPPRWAGDNRTENLLFFLWTARRFNHHCGTHWSCLSAGGEVGQMNGESSSLKRWIWLTERMNTSKNTDFFFFPLLFSFSPSCAESFHRFR